MQGMTLQDMTLSDESAGDHNALSSDNVMPCTVVRRCPFIHFDPVQFRSSVIGFSCVFSRPQNDMDMIWVDPWVGLCLASIAFSCVGPGGVDIRRRGYYRHLGLVSGSSYLAPVVSMVSCVAPTAAAAAAAWLTQHWRWTWFGLTATEQ